MFLFLSKIVSVVLTSQIKATYQAKYNNVVEMYTPDFKPERSGFIVYTVRTSTYRITLFRIGTFKLLYFA